MQRIQLYGDKLTPIESQPSLFLCTVVQIVRTTGEVYLVLNPCRTRLSSDTNKGLWLRRRGIFTKYMNFHVRL